MKAPSKVWYEIGWSEEAGPALRSRLVPARKEKRVIHPKGGGKPFTLKKPEVVAAELVTDWEEVTRRGFLVKVKARLGDLTFEMKQVGPFRTLKEAKKAAKSLTSEILSIVG